MSTDQDITRLRQLARAMTQQSAVAADYVIAHRRAIAEIDADWRIPPEQKHDGKNLQRMAARERAQALRDHRRTLRSEYDAILARLTATHRPGLGGAEAEMRRTAAWSRLERQLDALPAGTVRWHAVEPILDQAAATGDTDTLDAARRELGAYLAAHGEELPEARRTWLDFQSSIPGVAEARQIALENDRALYRSGWDVDKVAHSLGDPSGNDPDVLMGLVDGQTVDVSDDAALGALAPPRTGFIGADQ